MKQQDAAHTVEAKGLISISERQVYADVNRLLTFVSIFLLGLLASARLFPENPVGLGLKLIFFAFLILSLKNWIAAMLLVLAQIPLFLVPLVRKWNTTLTGDEIILVFQLLLMLALICRMHSPIGQPFTVLQTLKYLFRQDLAATLPRKTGLQTAAHAVRTFAVSTLLLSVTLLVITLLTSHFLQVVPMDSAFHDSLKSWARIEGWGFRLLVLSGLLFFCVLFTWLVVAEVNFRRLSVAEASIYLRSQVVKWLHRDFRMISRRQRRQNRKGS